jgi:hypothetical protein
MLGGGDSATKRTLGVFGPEVYANHKGVAIFFDGVEQDTLSLPEQPKYGPLKGSRSEVDLGLIGFSEYHSGTRDRVVHLDDSLHG